MAVCKEMKPLEKYSRRIALIGLSGVGKSTCLKNIYNNSEDIKKSDMDFQIDTNKCPSLHTATAWMINNGMPFFVVSNHLVMLREIANAKEESIHRDLFNQVYFVYLHASYEEIKRRLSENHAYGGQRDEGHKQGVLNDYDKMDKLFHIIQNKIIDTTNKDKLTVADDIKKNYCLKLARLGGNFHFFNNHLGIIFPEVYVVREYFKEVHAMDLKKEYDERLIKATDEYFLLESMKSNLEYIARTYGVYSSDLVAKIAKAKKARIKELQE